MTDIYATEISAVVPCFNEEECLETAYLEITAQLERFREYEIVFVDDGSTDRTLEIVQSIAAADPRVVYLSFTRNFGLEAAFTAGYRYARFPWIVQFDADLQSPPAELPALMSRAVEGFDVVFAMRVQRQDPLWRRWGSLAQHWVAGRVFGIELPYRGSVFRVVRTSVARKIVALELGMPYFMATVPLVGARYTSVPTEHRPRRAGRGKWNLRRLVAHTMELYTGYSFRLLALLELIAAVAVIGLVLTVLTGAGGRDIGGAVAWVSAVSAVLALAGLAVVGQYLRRIVRGLSRGPSMYLIRAANIELEPRDDLYEFETPRLRAADRWAG